MKLEIDRQLCVSCGLCEELAPELFRMRGDFPAVLSPVETEEILQKKEFALIDCPTGAIREI